VARSHPELAGARPDLEHGLLPDAIGETLSALVTHVERLEKRLDGHAVHDPALHIPDHGIWHGEEFSI